MNLCRACDEDFGSVSAFDGHRTGTHEYALAEGFRMDPPREDGRRCLYADELEAAGWHRDSRGRWRRPIRDANALLSFMHSRRGAETPSGDSEPISGVAGAL
jgi:hypothetical protein